MGLSDNLTYSYASGTGRLASVTDEGRLYRGDAAPVSADDVAYDAVANLTTFDAEPYRLGSIAYDDTDPCADRYRRSTRVGNRASGWRRRSKDPSSRIGSTLPTALTAGGTTVTYRYSAEGQGT